jgi:glutathione S-transferase
MARVILRYFAIVGRAQALRHTLLDAGTSFEDVALTLADWPSHRDDPSFAGTFGSLPTLTWGDVTVAETLPIAAFLSRRLGQYDGLDDAAIARREAICSSAYTDAIGGLGQLIWADMLYPGADVSAAFPRVLGRSLGKLARLDALVPKSGFFGGGAPCVADFFVVEAFEAHRHVLGPAHEAALRGKAPSVAKLAERVLARPALARVARPDRFTARPDEPAVLERLHAVDASALGL